jgi:ABC-type glycerol-3-phosphate transport system substrate-binding protein
MTKALGGVAAVAGALALAACGGAGADTATEAAAEGQQLDITAVDYKFEGAPETLEKGPIEVSFANEGKEAHMLVLAMINKGHTLEEAKKAMGEKGTATDILTIPPVEPGQEAPEAAKAEITDSGEYVLLCPLETKDGKFHYDLGQQYEYEVQ